MTDLGSERIRDEAFLVARILLAVLFLVFGWGKLTDYSGTVAYMKQSGAPLPPVAALVAMVIEFFGAIALILGACLWSTAAKPASAAITTLVNNGKPTNRVDGAS